MCPCMLAPAGAFLLTLALYCLGVVGVSPMLAHVAQGDALAIVWAAVAALGVVDLLIGVVEALSHNDKFDAGSFVRCRSSASRLAALRYGMGGIRKARCC